MKTMFSFKLQKEFVDEFDRVRLKAFPLSNRTKCFELAIEEFIKKYRKKANKVLTRNEK